LLRDLDTIALINFFAGRGMSNANRLLGERLGAKASKEYVGETGGQIGITLANFVAERITRGEVRLALLAGSNNMRTIARAQREGFELDWTTGGEGTPEQVGQYTPGSSELEGEYGLKMPPDIYPLFENALRARRGLSIDENRERMGRLMSPFTDVAAANPYAWFPTARSSEELTTVTPQNRMIAFPYPKYLNAVLQTDQAAGLIVCSVAAARAHGIPEERWVYWWGGAHSQEEAWWASERPDFAQCPAMLDTTTAALGNAGVTLGDVDKIDFYSCFPVAVGMACEMLGLDESDPRGFTVTGGLPYAGGPASAYCLHSLASMVENLRGDAGQTGLVTGNGWYLTKHAASVWSSGRKPGDPPRNELPARTASAERGLKTTPAVVAEAPAGKGRVEAYTVIYDREGAPARGIVLGRTADGERFLANTPGDRDLLEDFVKLEEVGREGSLSLSEGKTVFDPA
jgi:acetyl-CoA C-acetyltransferase